MQSLASLANYDNRFNMKIYIWFLLLLIVCISKLELKAQHEIPTVSKYVVETNSKANEFISNVESFTFKAVDRRHEAASENYSSAKEIVIVTMARIMVPK